MGFREEIRELMKCGAPKAKAYKEAAEYKLEISGTLTPENKKEILDYLGNPDNKEEILKTLDHLKKKAKAKEKQKSEGMSDDDAMAILTGNPVPTTEGNKDERANSTIESNGLPEHTGRGKHGDSGQQKPTPDEALDTSEQVSQPEATEPQDKKGESKEEKAKESQVTSSLSVDINRESIPLELRERPQWVAWEAVPHETIPGKFTKPPVFNISLPLGHKGRWKGLRDPANWRTFDAAVTFAIDNNLSGVGYCSGADVVGLDFDNCLDTMGTVIKHADAIAALREAGCYVETSPSGRGLRAFTLGSIPKESNNNQEAGVEMYQGDKGNYLTVTGNGEGKLIAVPELLDKLYRSYFTKSKSENNVADSDLGPMPELPGEDIKALKLPPVLENLITSGEGMEQYNGDHSLAVFGAAKDLLKRGISLAETCSILSDPGNYLAIHGSLKESRRGAAWLWEQILPKAKAEVDLFLTGRAADPIGWAANLSHMDCASLKKLEAKRLGMPVPDYDKAVTERRKAIEIEGFKAIAAQKAEAEVPELSREELFEKCKHIATSKNILKDAIRKAHATGIVGEETVIKSTYLVGTSRLFKKPSSLKVHGGSSSGKSFTTQHVLLFFPDNSKIIITAGSAKSMIYDERSYQHKILVILEATPIQQDTDDQFSYMLRTLISEGKIKYMVTVTGIPGAPPTTEEVTQEGPVSLIITTTATSLHAENETRLISVSTDESKEHTRNILVSLASGATTEEETEHNFDDWGYFQDWLSLGSNNVVVPFAPHIATLTNTLRVRTRRDFSQLIGLTKASALVHQYNRKTNDKGAIEATLDDYASAREIMVEVMNEEAGTAANNNVMMVVNAIAKLLEATPTVEYISISDRKLADKLKEDRNVVQRALNTAAKDGYLEKIVTHKGVAASYKLGVPLPGGEGLQAIPSVGDIENSLVCQ